MPQFEYLTGPDSIVAQVASTSPTGIDVPVFTLYGDGLAVTATDDGWLRGNLSAFEVQDYLADAASVGLLDSPLNLRRPGADGPADIVARFNVDSRSIDHAIDVARVDESSGLWRFLVQNSARNPFEFTTPFVPEFWITCATDEPESCRAVTEPTSSRDRPVLLGESVADLLEPGAS